MKEYKIIEAGGIFKKKADLLELLNQNGREGWHVVSSTHNQGGVFTKFLLERDKNRMM